MTNWPDVATRHDPWDVIVLGAGPAGSIAARQLALNSYHVLLIEKSRIPRFKVCGGCLSGAALDVLAEVGLGDLPKKCGGVTFQKMRLASCGATAEIDIGERIAVSREALDAALVEEATNAGATVCTETTGSVQSSDDAGSRSVLLRRHGVAVAVRAKAVVIATGLVSCSPEIQTKISPNSWVGLGAVTGPVFNDSAPGVLHMAWGAAGYVGIANVEDSRLDIAAAVNPRALAAVTSPGELISQILADSGLPVFVNLGDAIWRGTPLLTRHSLPLASRRCLLIGDAAGYVEPFTGEGIEWAMRSAILASTFLKSGLDQWNQPSLDHWHMLHERAFGGRQRQCRRVVTLMRNKTVRRVALWSLQTAPRLARPFIQRLDHLN
jgi:flavin-dependent dehydrogenase